MKEKIFGTTVFIAVCAFVIINTMVIEKQVTEIIDDISRINFEHVDVEHTVTSIYDRFKSNEIYFSLTVNHEDITDIEECFIEMAGYLAVGDTAEARVRKNRLIGSLEHLRRLSGFNVDSII